MQKVLYVKVRKFFASTFVFFCSNRVKKAPFELSGCFLSKFKAFVLKDLPREVLGHRGMKEGGN